MSFSGRQREVRRMTWQARFSPARFNWLIVFDPTEKEIK